MNKDKDLSILRTPHTKNGNNFSVQNKNNGSYFLNENSIEILYKIKEIFLFQNICVKYIKFDRYYKWKINVVHHNWLKTWIVCIGMIAILIFFIIERTFDE